jgi:hypothetical protein
VLTFIETKLFTRLVRAYLSDDEYGALQWALAADPLAGDVVRGTVESASFDGALPVAASVEGFA